MAFGACGVTGGEHPKVRRLRRYGSRMSADEVGKLRNPGGFFGAPRELECTSCMFGHGVQIG